MKTYEASPAPPSKQPPRPVVASTQLVQHEAHQPATIQRSISRHPVLKLQQLYGNRYVQRALTAAGKGDGEMAVTPEIEGTIERQRGLGRPLDNAVRTQMEAAFSMEFNRVRVHTGNEADHLNHALNARAFTTGHDIFFREGEYSPLSSGGRRLLAHELTHVVQQTGGIHGKLAIGQPDDACEQEADRVADHVVHMPPMAPDRAQPTGPRGNPHGTRCSNQLRQMIARWPFMVPLGPVINSQTVATSPGARTRTTIGVGEEVDLTYSTGSTAWRTTGGTLSAAAGATVRLTAPDTAQTVTVTAGGATIAFTVIAPSGAHMDRFPGTGIRHAHGRPDSGIQTRPFLLPDTVNFYRVQYREVDIGAVCTGVYTRFHGVGHDAHPATLTVSNTVVAGKGTRTNAMDTVYSGDPATPAPFTPGSITYSIPYEYKVGGGAFHRFTIVMQQSTLAADASTLTSSKAGATGSTTVAAATSTY